MLNLKSVFAKVLLWHTPGQVLALWYIAHLCSDYKNIALEHDHTMLVSNFNFYDSDFE